MTTYPNDDLHGIQFLAIFFAVQQYLQIFMPGRETVEQYGYDDISTITSGQSGHSCQVKHEQHLESASHTLDSPTSCTLLNYPKQMPFCLPCSSELELPIHKSCQGMHTSARNISRTILLFQSQNGSHHYTAGILAMI